MVKTARVQQEGNQVNFKSSIRSSRGWVLMDMDQVPSEKEGRGVDTMAHQREVVYHQTPLAPHPEGILIIKGRNS